MVKWQACHAEGHGFSHGDPAKGDIPRGCSPYHTGMAVGKGLGSLVHAPSRPLPCQPFAQGYSHAVCWKFYCTYISYINHSVIHIFRTIYIFTQLWSDMQRYALGNSIPVTNSFVVYNLRSLCLQIRCPSIYRRCFLVIWHHVFCRYILDVFKFLFALKVINTIQLCCQEAQVIDFIWKSSSIISKTVGHFVKFSTSLDINRISASLQLVFNTLQDIITKHSGIKVIGLLNSLSEIYLP